MDELVEEPGAEVAEIAPEDAANSDIAEEPAPEPAVAEEPAPEPAVAEEPAPEPAVAEELVSETRPRIPWWPFLVYGVLWIGLVAYAGTQISTAEGAVPAVEQIVYPYVVLAGLVLMLLGPLASIIVWLAVWLRAGVGRRGGLFTTALVRGSISTLLGVVAWWGALYVLDALRLGLIGPFG